jgi:hypothetical protein
MSAISPPAINLPIAYRFSNLHKLSRLQSDLDFVDVLVDTDIPLYLDPFAFKIGSDNWSIECNNLVVSFFQELINAMGSGNQYRARELLTNLHEPNETRLGLSRGAPQGRGIGRGQARDLYNAFAKSKAVQSGILTDLSDCQLFIDGISHDKISDITINIIRRKLVDFTKAQCRKWNIPMQVKPTGPYWHDKKKEWVAGYDTLPVYKGYPIILVPKRAVRYHLAVNDKEYYNFHVIEFIRQEFIRQENIHSAASLTKLLRAGDRRQRVTKKSVKEKHPMSKDFLREFSEDHPEVLKEYKRSAEENAIAGKHRPTNNGIYNIELKIAHIQNMYLIEEVTAMTRNTVHGDNFGAVGTGNRVTIRNIAVYKSEVDEANEFDAETKDLLKHAIDTIEAAEIKPDEKEDAKENLQKLTDELKQEKRPGVVQRILNRLAEVLPSVGAILGSSATIAQIVAKATGHGG